MFVLESLFVLGIVAALTWPICAPMERAGLMGPLLVARVFLIGVSTVGTHLIATEDARKAANGSDELETIVFLAQGLLALSCLLVLVGGSIAYLVVSDYRIRSGAAFAVQRPRPTPFPLKLGQTAMSLGLLVPSLYVLLRAATA